MVNRFIEKNQKKIKSYEESLNQPYIPRQTTSSQTKKPVKKIIVKQPSSSTASKRSASQKSNSQSKIWTKAKKQLALQTHRPSSSSTSLFEETRKSSGRKKMLTGHTISQLPPQKLVISKPPRKIDFTKEKPKTPEHSNEFKVLTPISEIFPGKESKSKKLQKIKNAMEKAPRVPKRGLQLNGLEDAERPKKVVKQSDTSLYGERSSTVFSLSIPKKKKK